MEDERTLLTTSGLTLVRPQIIWTILNIIRKSIQIDRPTSFSTSCIRFDISKFYSSIWFNIINRCWIKWTFEDYLVYNVFWNYRFKIISCTITECKNRVNLLYYYGPFRIICNHYCWITICSRDSLTNKICSGCWWIGNTKCCW